MNKIIYHLTGHAIRKARMIPLAMLVGLLMQLTTVAHAQTTVVITNPIPVIFGGAGITGVYPGYTNVQVRFVLSGGTDLVNLRVNVVGNPAGVTAGFVNNGLNPNSAANIAAVTPTTISTNLYLSVAVANAPKGSYPLEIIADNTITLVSFTNYSTLLVLPNVFTATTSSADTNWSTAANWSAGAPVAGDSVRFQYTNSTTSATNAYFDTSIVLDSLELMPKAQGLSTTNYFAPGVTIAVNGTNGFWAGDDNYILGTGNNYTFNFALVGAGASLVVTNPEAPFSMFSGVYQNVVGSKQDMSGLDNLYVDVKRVGVGDGYLFYPKITGTQPAQMGQFYLAKTNFMRATYVGDYSGVGVMTNSIMFFNSALNAGGAGSPFLYFGISNVFYADSISAFSQGSAVDVAIVKFNPAFTNGYAPTAVFRGTNGGRMSFFGAGIESGPTSASRTRAQGFDFIGGKLDMVVDQIVLARVATNHNDNYAQGYLRFYLGNVDANDVTVGQKLPTAIVTALPPGLRGELTVGGVGSNAVLTVKNNINLAIQTPVASAQATYGRVTIGSGGKIYVKNVTCGLNNSSFITIQNGGVLTVTNAICSPDGPLPTLTVQASGQLAFHVTAGVTNAFVTNLTDSVGAKINILSLNGFSPTVATNVPLISYKTAGTHNIAIGTVPAGYNNVSLFDNTAAQVIELRIATNAPAVLRWKGFVNNVWDHSTPNWQNTNSLAQVAFFDADTVIFEDAAGVPTTISISDFVIPSTSGTGIYMTNSTSAFSFENGGGQIGTCSMIKDGTANFTNNAVGAEAVAFNGGTLCGTGSLGGATISSNSVLNYAGTISGPLSISGNGIFDISAIANGSVTLQGTSVVTNFGTIQGGALAVNGTSLLVNQVGGKLRSIGSSGSINVATNATLINYGDIGVDPISEASVANTLTIGGTFKDMGIGSIYLTTATMNGGSKFLPGGDGIGTTQIRSASTGSTFPGRLLLAQNSTNIFKIDIIGGTYTRVYALYQDYGGSASARSQNGGFIVLTNVTGSFAAGQSYKLFSGIGGGDPQPTGQGTNTYPVIVPPTPGAGLAWDLTQLWPSGVIGVMNASAVPYLTNSFTLVGGTNIIAQFDWPSTNLGWRLQSQVNPLNIGLSNNWSNVTPPSTNIPVSWATNSYVLTNGVGTNAVFYRLVFP